MKVIPLHVHSEYSLVDSILRINDLIDYAKAEGLESIALTDYNNIYGLIKFYKKARAAGIKPILGCDLSVRNDVGLVSQLVLLAQNEQGFRHLNELISYAYENDQVAGEVAVNIDRFTTAQCEGLIALSGGLSGDIAHAIAEGDKILAEERAQYWQSVFADRFYLQITRLGYGGEDNYGLACQEIGAKLGIAATASNLACFKQPEDYEVHEARVCISSSRVMADETRPRLYTQNNFLRGQVDMAMAFADAPVLLANSETIAKRCNVNLTLGKSFLPDFPLPDGVNIESFLITESEKGLAERLLILFPDEVIRAEKTTCYHQRLKIELDVINQMGFPGYFLIVADFIRWAKDHDVPVGPGRGSGAGSLVAYALKITDLDPLAYDLLFERFLNPERVSMPDFDIDFCMEKRDLVIRYVADKYGHEKVSQIATHGTMAAKAVVRDVGRVMGISYGACDAIAKKIPKTLGVTLSDALGRTEKSQKKPEFFSEDFLQEYEGNEESRELIDVALKLEGLARNVGKHAGGVVIAPTRLTDFSALYAENAGSGLVTQFDKDDIEAAGLVKFDFLGLRTLTVIDWAMGYVNARLKREGEKPLDINCVALDDEKTFQLLKTARTSAVFQLESQGMKNLIKKLQPDNFEDIIALVALFRPGPLQSGMVDDFINRKHGLAEVEYPHPALEDILENTYGVMVYQEQVMQVAQILANYSLGEADLLRRAMGKKKAEVMEEQKEIFVERAVTGGVDQTTATVIFDLMAKFAEYGFNKSHSAAYALLSYHTAWLKAHYPAELMAAVLTSDMDKIDKVVPMVDEAMDMGLEVIPPCINRSQYVFTVDEDGCILFGLGAVKGVGENAVASLIAEREKNGPYASMLDLCRRVDLKTINKKTLETLISAGAFDVIDVNRGALAAAIPQAIKLAAQHHKITQSAQQDFFGVLGDSNAGSGGNNLLSLNSEDAWTDREKLEEEKKALGMYLTDHPINAVRGNLVKICCGTLAEKIARLNVMPPPNARRYDKSKVLLGGLVVDVRRIPSKKGGMLGFFTLDDRSCRHEFMIPPKQYDAFQHFLVVDNVLLIEADLEFVYFRNEWGFNIQQVYHFAEEEYRRLKGIGIHLQTSAIPQPAFELLQSIPNSMTEEGAKIAISLHCTDIEAKGRLVLGGKFAITTAIYQKLEQQFGRDNLQRHY